MIKPIQILFLFLILSFMGCNFYDKSLSVALDKIYAVKNIKECKKDSFQLNLAQTSGGLNRIKMVDDHILVLDDNFHSILVYDNLGNYLFSKLMKGRGPNEIEDSPYDIVKRDDEYILLCMGNRYTIYFLDPLFNIKQKLVYHTSVKHNHSSFRSVEPYCPDLYSPSGSFYSLSPQKIVLRVSDDGISGLEANPYLYEKQYLGGFLNRETGEIDSLSFLSPSLNRELIFLTSFTKSILYSDGVSMWSMNEGDGIINHYTNGGCLKRRYQIEAKAGYRLNQDYRKYSTERVTQDGYTFNYLNISIEDKILDKREYGYFKSIGSIPEKKLLCRLYYTGVPQCKNVLQCVNTNTKEIVSECVIDKVDRIIGYCDGYLYLIPDLYLNLDVDMKLNVVRVKLN